MLASRILFISLEKWKLFDKDAFHDNDIWSHLDVIGDLVVSNAGLPNEFSKAFEQCLIFFNQPVIPEIGGHNTPPRQPCYRNTSGAGKKKFWKKQC